MAKILDGKHYLVISTNSCARTYHPTDDAGVEHAKSLLAEQQRGELYVVKIVKIVRPACNVEVVNVK